MIGLGLTLAEPGPGEIVDVDQISASTIGKPEARRGHALPRGGKNMASAKAYSAGLRVRRGISGAILSVKIVYPPDFRVVQ